MPELTRNQAKTIAGNLRRLEGMIERGAIDPGYFSRRIEALENWLEFHRVNHASEYYSRLDEIKATIEKISKTLCDRIPITDSHYSGMSGKTRLKVSIVDGSLILSRAYMGQVSVTWGFNPHARIDFVGSCDIIEGTEEKDHTILEVDGFSEDNVAWDYKKARIQKELPERLYFLNPHFRNLREKTQYQSLIRYGHSTARELILNLDSGNIRPSFRLDGSEKDLCEIVKDPKFSIVKKVGRIYPEVVDLRAGYIMIYYRKRKE